MNGFQNANVQYSRLRSCKTVHNIHLTIRQNVQASQCQHYITRPKLRAQSIFFASSSSLSFYSLAAVLFCPLLFVHFSFLISNSFLVTNNELCDTCKTFLHYTSNIQQPTANSQTASNNKQKIFNISKEQSKHCAERTYILISRK